jgi:hypothetical protein
VTRTLTAIGIVMAFIPVSAHHSFSAYYLEEQSVTLEGVVQAFQYRSPQPPRDPSVQRARRAGKDADLRGRVGESESARQPGCHQGNAQAGRPRRHHRQPGTRGHRPQGALERHPAPGGRLDVARGPALIGVIS